MTAASFSLSDLLPLFTQGQVVLGGTNFAIVMVNERLAIDGAEPELETMHQSLNTLLGENCCRKINQQIILPRNGMTLLQDKLTELEIQRQQASTLEIEQSRRNLAAQQEQAQRQQRIEALRQQIDAADQELAALDLRAMDQQAENKFRQALEHFFTAIPHFGRLITYGFDPVTESMARAAHLRDAEVWSASLEALASGKTAADYEEDLQQAKAYLEGADATQLVEGYRDLEQRYKDCFEELQQAYGVYQQANLAMDPEQRAQNVNESLPRLKSAFHAYSQLQQELTQYNDSPRWRNYLHIYDVYRVAEQMGQVGDPTQVQSTQLAITRLRTQTNQILDGDELASEADLRTADAELKRFIASAVAYVDAQTEAEQIREQIATSQEVQFSRETAAQELRRLEAIASIAPTFPTEEQIIARLQGEQAAIKRAASRVNALGIAADEDLDHVGNGIRNIIEGRDQAVFNYQKVNEEHGFILSAALLGAENKRMRKALSEALIVALNRLVPPLQLTLRGEDMVIMNERQWAMLQNSLAAIPGPAPTTTPVNTGAAPVHASPFGHQLGDPSDSLLEPRRLEVIKNYVLSQEGWKWSKRSSTQYAATITFRENGQEKDEDILIEANSFSGSKAVLPQMAQLMKQVPNIVGATLYQEDNDLKELAEAAKAFIEQGLVFDLQVNPNKPAVTRQAIVNELRSKYGEQIVKTLNSLIKQHYTKLPVALRAPYAVAPEGEKNTASSMGNEGGSEDQPVDASTDDAIPSAQGESSADATSSVPAVSRSTPPPNHMLSHCRSEQHREQQQQIEQQLGSNAPGLVSF